MGADFIGAIVPITRTREQARAAFLHSSSRDIVEAIMGQFDTEEFEDPLVFGQRVIDKVYDAYEAGHRECTVWNFGGIDHLVTGGMSWGDPPTDMCRPIWFVDALRVTFDRLPILATDLADLMDECSQDGQWEGADICDALGELITRYGGWKVCAGTEALAGHGCYSASKDKCPWCIEDTPEPDVDVTGDGWLHLRESEHWWCKTHNCYGGRDGGCAVVKSHMPDGTPIEHERVPFYWNN